MSSDKGGNAGRGEVFSTKQGVKEEMRVHRRRKKTSSG